MTELVQQAISAYNLPLTILLGVMIVYWLVAIFGLIDFESADNALQLDSEMDMDLDVDGAVDGDMDFDTDVEAGGELESADDVDGGHEHLGKSGPGFGLGLVQGFFRFLGAVDAPVMFVLTLLIFYTWALNLAGNYYLNSSESMTLANLFVIGALVLAVFLTKISVRPLRPVAQAMRNASKNEPVIGRSGTVRSRELTCEYGQIEVITDGASSLLNVRLSDGCEPVPRGTEVLVVSQDETRNLYVVRPLD